MNSKKFSLEQGQDWCNVELLSNQPPHGDISRAYKANRQDMHTEGFAPLRIDEPISSIASGVNARTRKASRIERASNSGYLHPFAHDESTLASNMTKEVTMKKNSLLPKIAASAVGSLSSYQPPQGPHHQHRLHPSTNLAQRTHHSLNPVKSEGGWSSQLMGGKSLLNNQMQGGGQQVMGGRQSQHLMSPDEKTKIMELRKKISEATKSHHGMNSSPRLMATNSPHHSHNGPLSSSRKHIKDQLLTQKVPVANMPIEY